MFTYEWRTKTEPLLWYPDALAGVVHEYLTDGRTQHFRKLQKARVVTDVRYLANQLPKMRKLPTRSAFRIAKVALPRTPVYLNFFGDRAELGPAEVVDRPFSSAQPPLGGARYRPRYPGFGLADRHQQAGATG